tara:strand:+ start:719 stop:1162 length:444 start_codon:yes stop_codon:yes gene_type:complete
MKKIFFLCFILICFPSFAISDSIFLSLKKNKVNVRYGPGFDYEVKYIYRKKNLPVKVIDKKENFRKITDFKKNSGWIHISQLKKSKSFIIVKDEILFSKPSLFSKPIARIKKGRLLTYKKCKKNWCNVKTSSYNGWVKAEDVWGKTP